MELNKIYNIDCLAAMANIGDNSIDAIVTDPPYLYLERQKMERPFDEDEFFRNAFRILKDDGIICYFGRGVSFYRWGTICEKVGFRFLEEIIWDKGNITSPVLPLGRTHEAVAVFAKPKGKINRVHIPYTEVSFDAEKVIGDIRRLKSCLGSQKELNALEEYIKTNRLVYNIDRKNKFKTSCQEIRGWRFCRSCNVSEGSDRLS